jgi:hypothetical protein
LRHICDQEADMRDRHDGHLDEDDRAYLRDRWLTSITRWLKCAKPLALKIRSNLIRAVHSTVC